MGRSLAAGLALVIIWMTMVIVMVRAERVNRSTSAGLVWSTAKEERDLLPNVQSLDDASTTDVDRDEIDGGFSSLDGMLQWAIGHSDPQKLRETAEDLKKRQVELQELMERLQTPSDAQLIQIAIGDLDNSSLSLEDRLRALQELLILVEPIDNANDLNKLGGFAVIIKELNHPDTDVRKISAWILGKASQNNPIIQKQVLELGALTKLMKMVKSSFVEEAIKALYAVSALIRNNLAGQEMFYAEAGDLMLQDLLSNSSVDIRLLKKAVFLIGDLLECQLENTEKAELPFFSNRFFLKSVVDLTSSTDLDLQEKALIAIKNLLQLRTIEALVFEDFCDLDGALERMRLQLLDLMVEEYSRDYALDVESLRKEVELIFHRKLGKVTTVPT
ncbi:Fes1 domain-containing protein [Cephalotus follicularis]|uniref:Fes1 domain-containing protein n=1 Tax=Cephalotus follicularis TaxID=3775 RepID=A0A1Q3CBF6_CEPFO|nr:Fes1 domain-containing protein [Cephalotus follicularis]